MDVEPFKNEVKKYLKKNDNFDMVIVLVDKFSYKFKHDIKKLIT